MKRILLGAVALLASASTHAESTVMDACDRGEMLQSLRTLQEGGILFGANEEPTLRALGEKLMEVDLDVDGSRRLYDMTANLLDRRVTQLVNDRDLVREWKETMLTRVSSLFITRPDNRSGEIRANNRGTFPELTQRIANTSRGAAWCAAFISFAARLTECALQESFAEVISPFTDLRKRGIEKKLSSENTPPEEKDSLRMQESLLEANLRVLAYPEFTKVMEGSQSWLFDAVNNALVHSLVYEASLKGRLVKRPSECRPGMAIAWVDTRSKKKPGHIAIIREVIRQKSGKVVIRTVEANTGIRGADDNERVGGATAGVYPKKYGPGNFNLPGSRKAFQGCIEVF